MKNSSTNAKLQIIFVMVSYHLIKLKFTTIARKQYCGNFYIPINFFKVNEFSTTLFFYTCLKLKAMWVARNWFFMSSYEKRYIYTYNRIYLILLSIAPCVGPYEVETSTKQNWEEKNTTKIPQQIVLFKILWFCVISLDVM